MKNNDADKKRIIECPNCKIKFDLESLNKNEWGVESDYLIVRCPHCGDITITEKCPNCDSMLTFCINTEYAMGYLDDDTTLYEWLYCKNCNYYRRLK